MLKPMVYHHYKMIFYQFQYIDQLLLLNALTDKINDRSVYMKGIDTSYQYEGYNTYSMNELDNES